MDGSSLLVLGILDFIIVSVVIIAVVIIFGNRTRRVVQRELEEYVATRRKLADEEATRILSEADSRAKELELRARDEAQRLLNEAEDIIRRRRD
jgi:23S rRNA pseudoU1915 N3-methylase RlmH